MSINSIMKIFYHDTFPIPLPENHSFPKDKYFYLRKKISERFDDTLVDLRIPEPVSKEAILRAHDAEYIHRFIEGRLTEKEIRRVGLPWSPQIVTRAQYSTGATIAACRAALSEGVAVNLGGGTHHAYHDHGQGFCWLNDSVIAARSMQAEGLAEKILVIDCDVHQGNGTAAMVRHDPTIFTFSIHGRNNFPYHKEVSDLDIDLADGTDDKSYLEALDMGVRASMRKFKADLAIYLAGADPYEKDRLGRLALTKAGLARRDRLVIQHLQGAGLSVAVTMGGGYAPDIHDVVDIHFRTIEAFIDYKKRYRINQNSRDSKRLMI